jgi:hypothetical protein
MDLGGSAFVGHKLRAAEDAARKSGQLFPVLPSRSLTIGFRKRVDSALEVASAVECTLTEMRIILLDN